ncbi:MAG: hypothetical protein OHK0023_10890 [Anaerolineae bacterium]
MSHSRFSRPIGLSLAILGTAVAFGLFPLLPACLLIYTTVTGRQIGVELIGGIGWVSIAFGVITVIACFMAWRGRPRGVRLFLLIIIWSQTIFFAARFISGLNTPPDADLVSGVGGNLSFLPLLLCQLPLVMAVPLYVTWYLNRAPARAFYGENK